MQINSDDLAGVRDLQDNNVYCLECRELPVELTEEQVVTTKQVADFEGLWFCDKCGKQL